MREREEGLQRAIATVRERFKNFEDQDDTVHVVEAVWNGRFCSRGKERVII
jgi:hypothetical protein